MLAGAEGRDCLDGVDRLDLIHVLDLCERIVKGHSAEIVSRVDVAPKVNLESRKVGTQEQGRAKDVSGENLMVLNSIAFINQRITWSIGRLYLAVRCFQCLEHSDRRCGPFQRDRVQIFLDTDDGP